MNFVGKFDTQVPSDGSAAPSHVHVEHPTAHAPTDAIIVPDAHLLFGADFKRAGVDLILSNADRELVVHDYFKGEHRHPLASPDGAHLTGDIVNALTGQVQYAQAGAPDAVAHVIGHVTKLTGSATAIRNGVSVILNNGDNVEKGDVVATGSDTTLGVTFIDGTVFGLSSNARMVLNEMVYDPNGSNNSSLISLVAGTISFVAGETAKHGDMKVDTPVATMGIRGTAVLVEIDFNVPNQNGLPDAKFQVLVEPDGSTGSYILFDKTTLDPIATVNRAGQQVNINQNGVSYTNSPLTPELQKLISDVFTQKFSTNTDPNTKSFDHFTDSIVPQPFQGFKGPDNIVVQAVFVQTNSLGNGPSQNQGSAPTHPRVDVAPDVHTTNGLTGELPGLTGSHTPDVGGGLIKFADLNEGDAPTASTAFNSFVFQNAQKQDISHSLTPTELAAVQAVEVGLNVVQDPAGINVGVATWTYSVPDGSLDFLGAGETLTLTYLATVSNNFAQSIKTTTVPITITITGTNDVPVITSAVPQTIAFDGGTNVPGGTLTPHVPTSGTINFDDPDLTDTHTVSIAAPTSTLTDPVTHTTTAFILPPTPLAIFNEALTASIAIDSTGTGLGTINWSLAELPVWLGDVIPVGDILTLTYAVTVTDSQGATSTQDITVTITGTDRPAVVWIATTGTGPAPDGLWSTGTNWETGTVPTASDDAIIITNQLEGLTPTYPVTITSAVGVSGTAANSLTMDNFGGSAPVLINQVNLAIGTTFDINDHSTDNPVGYTGPEFDNQGTGTVTIGGAFNLNGDAVVHNAGSITVTGKMEALDQSTVQNSGTITLAGGGDFAGQSTISNTITGALIEVSSGLLNVDVDISNLGTVKIDPVAALTLSSAAIDGGTLTNNGTLTLDGDAVVKNGTLGNSGQINVSGSGNALDNEKVTNTGGIEIAALGALTLDLLTSVTNTGHTITVDGSEDGTGTLTLQGGSSITGGNLSNSGTVDIEGSGATLDGVTVTGSGSVNIDVVAPETLTTLILKDTTSFTNGTLTVGPSGILSDIGSVTLDHVGVANQNFIEVGAGGALTLDSATTVDNTSGTITVDGTGRLTLNDASIDGGTINDFTTGAGNSIIAGDIDVTGSSTISNVHLNNGNVTLGGNVTLKLDGSTVTGTSFDDTASGATIQLDGGDTLTLSGATIDGGTINAFTSVPSGSIIAGDIDVTGSSTISNAHLNNGNVTIGGNVVLKLDGSTVTGTSFDDTASGATIQLDGGDTLTLSGATIDGGTINAFTSVPSGSIIAGDIDVTGSSTISNAHLNNGNVTIGGNVVLNLDGSTVAGTSFDDTASGAVIQIDGDATLTLSGVQINGGTINAFTAPPSGSIIAGDIDVTGSSTISNAHLNNGNVTIGGNVTLTLTNDTVAGASFIDTASGATIQIVGNTALDDVTISGGSVSNTFNNAGTTITVESGHTLELQDGVIVSGGTIDNLGTLDIESVAGATLNGVTIIGGGAIEVDVATSPVTTTPLVLEGGTEIDGGTLMVGATSGAVVIETAAGATLDHVGVTNDRTIEVVSGGVLVLDDGTTVDNGSGTLTIDGGGTLTLNDASITGGPINNYSAGGSGSIDVTGSSTISNAALNNGDVTIGKNVTLNLDGSTVTGTSFDDTASGAVIQIDGDATLTLSGATINGGAINAFTSVPSGSIIAGDIDVIGSSTISNAHLNNGNVTIGGNVVLKLDGSTVTGTSFDDTASGATIQIDGGDMLTLSGATINGGTINAFTSVPSGSIIAGDIDVIGSSTISNAHLNNGNVTIGGNVVLNLDGSTVTGASFDDTASGATIQIDGGDTLTLNGVNIHGGAVDAMDAGSLVQLENTTIDGATLGTGDLTDANSGLFQVEATSGANTSILDGSVGAVSVAGYVQVETGANLELIGTIHNSGTIDIDPAASTPTLSSLKIQGTVTLDGGGTVTLDGPNDQIVAASGGGTLNNYEIISGNGSIGHAGDGALALHNESGGLIVATGGTLTIDTDTTFVNDGTIEANSGGRLVIDDVVTGTGSAMLNGGTLEIAAGATDAQAVTFGADGGKLQIDQGGSFSGSISGLVAGDQIDLSTIGYGLDTTATYVGNAAGGTLTVTDGTNSIELHLVGNYTDAHFAGSADSNYDLLITLNANDDAPAFVSGQTTPSATVAEIANVTNSSTTDDSSPTGGAIHFTDIDLTDRPTATVTQTVTWTGGTLTSGEQSALEGGFKLTPVINTNNGGIDWTYAITDNSLDFLGAGETATVTASITLDDHQGGTDTATVTVEISGSNDAPVLAADTSGTNGTGLHAIAERAGKTGDTTDVDSASGSLSFTDVDLNDSHKATESGPTYTWSGGSLTTAQINALTSVGTLALTETDSTHTGAGSVGFNYSAADSTFDFLAAGETLTVTYDITVTDKSGVSSSQPVSFTVTGSNDAPVLAADTSGTNGTGLHAIAERAGKTGDTTDVDSASGSLSFTDVDLNDTHKATESGPTYTWSGGSLTTAQINALTSAGTLALTETDSTHTGAGSVGFTYSAADSTFDFLGAGQTLTVTYDITVTDHSGISSSEPVTFTVTGSNDAPTIVGETNPATQTIILAQSPFVLSAGTSTNSLGLPTETFDEAGITAGSASNNGSGHGTFTNSALGAQFNSSGNAGVVHGSSSVTAAPFIGPLPGHADTTNYLSIGANGSETITFTTQKNEFGLYWGSVDTFNTVSFYNGNQLVASYSGADVAPLLANGNQGSFSASGYVEFSDLAPFTKVVLASGSSNAFEIDNISAGFVSDSHVHLAGPITGTLTVNDADIGDTLTASVTGNAVATYNGSTTLPTGLDISALIASGAITFDSVKTSGGQDVLDWTYHPTNANLDFLEPGDKLTLTFNAAVSDGHATTANQALTITLVGNGSSVVNGTAQNDTFTDVGGGVTISGDGGHDIYNFNAHFGSATITDFDVSNDVIDISSTLFTSVTALLNSAVGSGANTIITDSAGDQITLDHVSVAQLKAHPGDFQFTIANSGTFEASASTSENVVFEGSTGKLTIDTPSTFNGVISGFTGNGTLSGSDQIDLKGIDYNSSHFTESFDAANETLSVSDGSNSALLHFNGTYQAANFKFTTDNSGGTIVYDPPVPASTTSNVGADTPPVSNNGHGFVFNFADNGHDLTGSNHPAIDTHLFDHQQVTDAGAALNRLHDDSHVVPPITSIDGHDPSAAAAVKAQWHASDFHFA